MSQQDFIEELRENYHKACDEISSLQMIATNQETLIDELRERVRVTEEAAFGRLPCSPDSVHASDVCRRAYAFRSATAASTDTNIVGVRNLLADFIDLTYRQASVFIKQVKDTEQIENALQYETGISNCVKNDNGILLNRIAELEDTVRQMQETHGC